MLNKIINEAKEATQKLILAANIKKGDIFVVGCSSSEVCGDKIGTNSSIDVGKALFSAINEVLCEKGIFLAAQCCEHLNRAVVIERECLEKYGFEEVCVVPQPKAGGSFATAAYKGFENAVVAEEIKAHAGIDIGGTLIGMHLKRVAVPVRLDIKKIGEAPIICAKTRPRLIGGERAIYNMVEDVKR